MKTKKIFLVAAMLLMSVCSFAQNNNIPLLGDVTGDGKVDVADIVAILKIMKDAGGTAGGTTYYWYAGQTQPASMTSNPTVDDSNFTNNKWHTLGITLPTTINQKVTGGTAGNEWFVVTPKDQYVPTASDLSTPDGSQSVIETITIGTMQYDVWSTGIEFKSCNVLMKKQ